MRSTSPGDPQRRNATVRHNSAVFLGVTFLGVTFLGVTFLGVTFLGAPIRDGATILGAPRATRKKMSKDRQRPPILRGVAAFPELSHERVAQALAGDRAAFAEVYETYEPAVRLAVVAAIRHRPALESELEDFIGEIWARFVADGAWRLRSYDPERGSFGYYLRMRAFAIARALASARIHRGDVVAITDPVVSLWSDDGLEGRVIDREALERLWAAMRERLSAVDLALFQGVLVEGRPVREVGEPLGLSEAAAYRRSHRLKQKIERIAQELQGADAPRGGSTLVVLLASSLALPHAIDPERSEPQTRRELDPHGRDGFTASSASRPGKDFSPR